MKAAPPCAARHGPKPLEKTSSKEHAIGRPQDQHHAQAVPAIKLEKITDGLIQLRASGAL
jgi:hypothetical protein